MQIETLPARLLTAKEAAPYLGISSRGVQRLILDGKLKCVRLGPQTIRIAPADLAEFIEKLRAEAK